jgi:hypothetical protein
LVHLSGRVCARTTISSLIDERPAVYRRLRRRISGWVRWATFGMGEEALVYEKAVDFLLIDNAGEAVLVDVRNARLIATRPKYQRLDRGPAFERILALPLLDKRPSQKRIAVAETLLADGDRVDILGYESRTDATAERLPREAPLRATIRSGSQFPLLLVRAPTE